MVQISISFKFSCFLFGVSIFIAYKWTSWFADTESTFNLSFTIAKRVWQTILFFAVGLVIGKILNFFYPDFVDNGAWGVVFRAFANWCRRAGIRLGNFSCHFNKLDSAGSLKQRLGVSFGIIAQYKSHIEIELQYSELQLDSFFLVKSNKFLNRIFFFDIIFLYYLFLFISFVMIFSILIFCNSCVYNA